MELHQIEKLGIAKESQPIAERDNRMAGSLCQLFKRQREEPKTLNAKIENNPIN